MRLNSVDLPAPFGPMIEAICPCSTARLTFWTAMKPPNDFVAPSTRSSKAALLTRGRDRGRFSVVAVAEGGPDFGPPEMDMDEDRPQDDDHQSRRGRPEQNVEREGGDGKQ